MLPSPPTPVCPPHEIAQETDGDYESDFEVDKEILAKPYDDKEEKLEANDEYDNDSFIIDDDGKNKDGDLTGSSVSSGSPISGKSPVSAASVLSVASDASVASIADSISREADSKVSN